MKKTILLGMSALLSAALFSGCSDDWSSSGKRAGHIAPLVGLDTDAVSSADSKAGSRAEAAISAADLSVRLTKADGSYTQTWPTVADFPVDKAFSTGTYTFEAFYGDTANEGFESPAYAGAQQVTVVDGQTTSVGLTASMANCRFVIDYTDAFKGYMADWSASVRGAGDAIAYERDEVRPVYVQPGKVYIDVTFEKPNGLSATVTLPAVDAEAKHHYNLTVDVNDGNVGDAKLIVTFDDNLLQEDVEVDISDNILQAPLPEATAEGFTSGQAIDVVAGLPSELSLQMNLVAQAGLGEVLLETSSVSLLKQGWPASINLLAADAAQQNQLKALGFSALGLWKNPDQMAVLDFSAVIPYIKAVDTDNTTRFTLVVKDKLSRASQPVELVINIEDVQLEIAAAGEFYNPGENLTLSLSFNGANPEDEVAVEYYNPASGSYKPADVVSITPASRSTQTFTVVIKTPELDGDLKIRATCGTAVSSVTIPGSSFTLEGNATDVYATQAYVYLKATEGSTLPDASTVSFEAKAAGASAYSAVSATAVGNYFLIKGLKAGTDYQLRAGVAGCMSKPYAIHTEAATQLENSGLESWSNAKSGKYWTRWAIPGWATYNEMTTSVTGTREDTSYVNRSGAEQSTDAHSGNYAAELSAVGWGSGNGAYGDITTSHCKYLNKGMLYLGVGPTQYSEMANQIVQGIGFASRPTALTFWYKYAAKNSADYGAAQVWVKDAAGRVLASGSVSNLNATSYTQVTIPLTYAGPGTAKAARIFVEFTSTDNPNWDTRNTSWWTVPKLANLTDGKFKGSSMFVDDIALTY